MKLSFEIKRIIDNNEKTLNEIKSENSIKLKEKKFAELRKIVDKNPKNLIEDNLEEQIL